LRALEKAAVLAGGGSNHRHGLFDAVMIKDNHLVAAGGHRELQRRISELKKNHPTVMIEIEADTLEQVRHFFTLEGVTVILLDNMNPIDMAKAVVEKPAGMFLEASGGINLESIRSIAETGIDFISIGALTHSAKSIDLSMEIFGTADGN
jgi:nicotinate-nucleotide pyrophosphorylase (carboxylating)